MVNITHSRYRPMQSIMVKGDIIELKPYAIMISHRITCICSKWFKKVKYKQRHLSEGGVYDCSCTVF